MKKYLTNLNGWQRFFVFILLFIYVPITVDRIASMEFSTSQKYSDNDLKIKANEFIKKENIENSISIEDIKTDFAELAKKFGGSVVYKNDREELEALRSLADVNKKIGSQTEPSKPMAKNSELIKTRFVSDGEYYYIATFKYLKEPKLFDDDADIKKIAWFIQGLINQTKIKSEVYFEFLKKILYFSLAAFLTYFLGYMIGWVIDGFKRKKES